MGRKLKARRHPNREIEAALRYARSQGWEVFESGGHPWGILRCPENNKDCRDHQYCQMSIWSTPKRPEGFAKKIRVAVDGCMFPKKGKD